MGVGFGVGVGENAGVRLGVMEGMDVTRMEGTGLAAAIVGDGNWAFGDSGFSRVVWNGVHVVRINAETRTTSFCIRILAPTELIIDLWTKPENLQPKLPELLLHILAVSN